MNSPALDMFAEVFRSNIEESVVHWNDSKKYLDREENFEKISNQFILSLRSNSILYLASTWNINDLLLNEHKLFTDQTNISFNPLYTIVSSSVIQLIVNGVQNIITEPEKFIDSILTVCESHYIKGGIFACVIFPMLYMGLQIKEMLYFGEKLVIHIFEKSQSKFAIQLLCTFFNLYPAFIDITWSYFCSKNINKNDDIIDIFAESLKIGASKLTISHVRIIKEIKNRDSVFLAKFLFKYYIPDAIRVRYEQSLDFINQDVFRVLLQSLDFCVHNPQSLINEKYINAFLNCVPMSPELSFNIFPKPFMYSALSGLELSILYDILFLGGNLKITPKIISLRKNLQTPRFGSLLIPIRKFIIEPTKKLKNQLLFKEEEINIMNNQKYLRIYQQLKLVGKEVGQSPLAMITRPKTPRAAKIIFQHKLKEDPNFILYVALKSRKKASKSKFEFEEFMKNKWIMNIFMDLTKEYIGCFNLYKNILANDIVIQNCMISFQQTSIFKDENMGTKPYFYNIYVRNLQSKYIIPKKDIIIVKENNMRSGNFAECLSFVCQKCEMLPKIFVYNLLDEWNTTDISELQHRFENIAELERCEIYGASFFFEIINNKYLKMILNDMCVLTKLGLGSQIRRLLKILESIDLIETKYGNCRSFEEITLKLLILCGCDCMFTASIWMMRLNNIISNFFDEKEMIYISKFINILKKLVQSNDPTLLSELDNATQIF